MYNSKCISTYVDHDCLLAKLVQRHSCVDSTPVELDGTANAVDTAAQHNYAVVVECNIVGGGVVGGVEVVCVGWESIHTRQYIDIAVHRRADPTRQRAYLCLNQLLACCSS